MTRTQMTHTIRTYLSSIGLALLAIVLISCQSKAADRALAKTEPAQFTLEIAFPNLRFEKPVDLQTPRDGSNRLFVVEQDGRIFAFANDPETSNKNLFLDITHKVRTNHGEEGLLGLAFHPNFAENGYFFLDYTASNPRRTVIARYQVKADNSAQANPASETVILEIEQPYGNHNGGQIAFGPDGYLYIAMGDGGSAGDPQGHGQNLKTLLGAILRIDVDQTETGQNYAVPTDNPFYDATAKRRLEIYAYGLRNPWRFSFDPETGWLWTGDVGQNHIEEVDIVEKGKNYGWNIMEGTTCYRAFDDCDQSGLELPIIEYNHDVGKSITGGYVYRGKRVPALVGRYVYADYMTGRVWALAYNEQQQAESLQELQTDFYISSFGVDAANELYLCNHMDGRIYGVYAESQ